MGTTVIVDYGIGNVFSVANALKQVGANVELSRTPATLRTADRLVLPGVGAFGKARAALDELGLPELLTEFRDTGRPFLGICVGMQMLFDESTEFGIAPGLGFIPGRVDRIPDKSTDSDEPLRIPHVAWARLVAPDAEDEASTWSGSPLEGRVGQPTDVYFVHSFHGTCADPAHRLAEAEYGGNRLTAAVRRDNIIGFQFHPERSGPVGLDILRAFLES